MLTTASFGSGLIFLLPFTLAELFQQGWPAFGGPSLAAGVYLGVMATALPMFAWNYALQYIPASTAAAFLNLVPIVGVASSLIVGETIGPLQIVGGAAGGRRRVVHQPGVNPAQVKKLSGAGTSTPLRFFLAGFISQSAPGWL